MDNNILYELHDDITPEFILSRIPQQEIYQRYLGLTPEPGSKFCNPLRKDRNPTCSFSVINGKLVFRDWSEHIYMDVFDVVQRKFNVDFNRAMDIIASDFGLTDGKAPPPVYPTPEPQAKTSKPRFDVTVQPLTDTDQKYLKQFGISKEIARKFNVFSVRNLKVDGNQRYRYSSYDPALGYYFGLNSSGQQKWKIYYYYRTQHRFLSNTSRLNGWVQLPIHGQLVVITKSLKDIMTLYGFGVPATGTQSEGVLPDEDTIQELKLRFHKVVSLYDFEPVGIRSAQELKRRYGIHPFMFTDGSMGTPDYGSKDISDYFRDHGQQQTKQVIDKALKSLSYGITSNPDYTQLSSSLQSL